MQKAFPVELGYVHSPAAVAVSWPHGVTAVLEGACIHQEAVAHIWLWNGVYFWLTTGAEAQNRERKRTMCAACAPFVQGNGLGMYNLTLMKCFLKRDFFFPLIDSPAVQ